MAKILVIAEHRAGKLKKSTFELLSACSASGNETAAALLCDSAGDFAKELGSYGASKVFTAQNPVFKNYLAEAYTLGVLEVIKTFQPDIIVSSHTPTGRDLMPHVAARLNAGLATDCTVVTFSGGNVQAKRPIYAGKAIAEIEFIGAGPKLLTIRANTFGAPKADPAKTAQVVAVNCAVDGLKTKFLDTVAAPVTRPDVTEASIVVSGGRSLKSADNFKILETMADVLGAAVGASRAAVDAGFRPHRDQVGQTGKVVSPSLYIACGISGAIQHLAGMRTSKTIVAINTDPEAPIFQVADYGIVGDLFTMVPLLTQEFKKIKES